MSLTNLTSERGKDLQTETFQAVSPYWQITPSMEGDYSHVGLTLRKSARLVQTAKTTFGFVRLSMSAELVGDDEVALHLKTNNEEIVIGKTASTIYVSMNHRTLVEHPNTSTNLSMQLVLNDERVGCMVIGSRVIPLLSRQQIASFQTKPYEFIVSTTILSSSTVVLKELRYESVHE
jgi:hypothetical protein